MTPISDILKLVDIYSGATNYLGEVPTHTVRDTSSAIHNFHPPEPLEVKENLFEEEEFQNRFWNSSSHKRDPTMKPIAQEVDVSWPEPPQDYEVKEEDRYKYSFTSEIDLNYWLVQQGGGEIEEKKG